jgi:uncharacterized membrane protein YkoI
MNKGLLTLLVELALLAAGPADFGPSPAAAQTCYSTEQARASVQSRQVQPLSSLIAQVQAVAPGQIVSSQLCLVNGRFVYMVSVLVGGAVRLVQVDAVSGGVL